MSSLLLTSSSPARQSAPARWPASPSGCAAVPETGNFFFRLSLSLLPLYLNLQTKIQLNKPNFLDLKRKIRKNYLFYPFDSDRLGLKRFVLWLRSGYVLYSGSPLVGFGFVTVVLWRDRFAYEFATVVTVQLNCVSVCCVDVTVRFGGVVEWS